MGAEDLAARLAAIADELGALAYDALRRASESVRDGGGPPDPALLAEERRLTRARRAVEKASHLLEAPARAADDD